MAESAQSGSRGACLILGATGGIGSALARSLAADGVPLILAARSMGRLMGLAEELGARARAIDAESPDEVKAIIEEEGPISAAVNCVGSIFLKPAHLTTAQEFDDTMRRNAVTAFNLVRSAAPAMRSTGGSIVLTSSCAATVGLASHEAIAAAKAAVEGLTRAAAASYAAWNVRVNAIAPGLVNTPLSERITSNETALEASRSMHPIGRIGEPTDVARAIRWLLDPASDWITGEVIAVDGGLANLRSRAASHG